MPEHIDTYIDRYIKYTQMHEAPDVFHLWCAITAAGFALGRTAWINMGFYTIYPNFYTVLVAGSGECRKGGALSVMRDLVISALHNREDRKFIPGKVYPEALIQLIANQVNDPLVPNQKTQRAVFVFSPELGSFMSKSMQNLNMPDLLMELHDCPEEHEHITKHAGQDRLRNVFLSFASATTPTWMQRNVNISMLSEGFIARTLLVYGARPKIRVPRQEITPELVALRAQLIQDLRDLSTIRGPFTFAPSGAEFWDNWYNNYEQKYDIASESGFSAREHTHVLRVALVLAACAGLRELHAQQIASAVHLVNQIRINMHIPLLGANVEPDQRGKHKVLHAVKTHGGLHGITLTEISRRLFNDMSPDDILAWLSALKTSGMIRIYRRQIPGQPDGEGEVYYQSIDYTADDRFKPEPTFSEAQDDLPGVPPLE